MKIKIMLSVGLLVSTLSPDLQAMGGARDFVRKVFLSKTAAFAAVVGCIRGGQIIDETDKFIEDLVEKYQKPNLPSDVEKTIQDAFAQDGIAVTILKDPVAESPLAVCKHRGKGILFLSDAIVDKLNDRKPVSNHTFDISMFLKLHAMEEKIDDIMGNLSSSRKKQKQSDERGKPKIFFEKMNQACKQQRSINTLENALIKSTTKDEIFAMVEHEKGHLKNHDQEKLALLQAAYCPSIILGVKALNVYGKGSYLAIGANLFALASFFRLSEYFLQRHVEKKADLSISNSKQALLLACNFEKTHFFQSKILTIHLKGVPFGEYVTLERFQKIPFLHEHPPHLERARYLRDHARYLEQQERAIQENKK